MLVIEDGGASRDATSYVSVADFKAYFAARGVTLSGEDAALEGALVSATQYLDNCYRKQWKGQKKTLEQALCWPRYGVIVETDDETGVFWIPGWGTAFSGFALADNVVPQRLKDATCEAAYRVSQGKTLVPDVKPGDAMKTSETIGPISTSWAAPINPLPRYPWIEMLISDLISYGLGTAAIIRG